MGTAPLTDEAVMIAVNAYLANGRNGLQAAAALGWGRNKMDCRLRVARQRRLLPDETAAPAENSTTDARETRDAAFWKRKFQDTVRELGDVSHALDEVSGVMSRPIYPASWALPSATAKHRAAGLLTISDIHAGEVIDPSEMNGRNSYDVETCRRRLRRLFAAAIDILPRWSSDCRLEGVYVALNGDLISGDIHDELRETNAITSQEQVYFVADELAGGIEKLHAELGPVEIVVTPGNHGRQTHKTHAKRTARLSFDMMVGKALANHFRNNPNVNVHNSPSRDAEYSILGWRVLQTHHDQGGGGGAGFAGTALPIARKVKSIEYMASQGRQHYDMIITGHYHTSMNLGKTLANGSVVGYGEFAQSIRASPEVPQQWLALVTEKWGMRERAEIKLEDVHRQKPRVSVRAA